MSIFLISYSILPHLFVAWDSRYKEMGMWRDSLWRIPPIGFIPVEIRGAGPCRMGVHTLLFASCGVLSEGYGHGSPASAWAMARRKPKMCRRKMDAATR